MDQISIFRGTGTMGVLEELRGVFRLRALQLIALCCLLAGLASLSFIVKTSVRDPDLWWHVKVGDWIVEHHAVPHVGIFSRTAATRPWIAYSWGYEVLLSRAYAWFGLMGFALFGVVLTVAVGYVCFWMLHRLSGDFWKAWALAAAGCYAFLFNVNPRPVFVSMALFAVTLALILEAHRTGRVERLYWLPLIFVFWANLHIQFTYGLFVLGLFVAVHVLQQLGRSVGIVPRFLTEPKLPVIRLLVILAACTLAGCVGPYSFHIYRVVMEYSRSRVPYTVIQELQAPDFKYLTDYVMLLLTAAGFYTVGSQKRLDLFKLLLLTIASAVAFRTTRDAFFVCIPAAAFIADATENNKESTKPALKVPEFAAACVVLTGLLWLIAMNTGFNGRELDRAISRQYPVDAANFLRRNPVPGPLYNDLGWGGFLIWYLPNYPVAIDGRNDLYGDELDRRSFQTTAGQSYDSDPYLNEARLVLLPKAVPLSSLLANDPKYRLIYEDELSVVLVRR
jgi:hypothetical protein